jgi:hypothetical protein
VTANGLLLAAPRRSAAALAPATAIALILYLPLEPAILSAIPGGAYWVLRLLPDAAVALLAAMTLILDGSRPARPTKVIWATAAIVVALVVANWARGIEPTVSINAARVLIRYMVMAFLIWRWWSTSWASPRAFGLALVAAGAIQAGLGIAEGLPSWLDTLTSGRPFTPIDGTMGRYDRYGMFMTALALVLIAATSRGLTWRLGMGIAVALLCLSLSASRQAELGLAVAAASIALITAMTRPTRLVAGGAAVAAVLLVLLSPARIAPPAGGAEIPPPGTGEAASAGGLSPSPSEVPVSTSKGSSTLSIDPNGNFRLYLNLNLTPWSVTQNPVLGLGPGSHVNPDPETPLANHVERDGMDWAYAVAFMNDSNYASLVIQFGMPIALLFLAVVVRAISLAAGRTRKSGDVAVAFAFSYGVAVAVAAFFGPAFEIRTVSAPLWIGFAVALVPYLVSTREEG